MLALIAEGCLGRYHVCAQDESCRGGGGGGCPPKCLTPTPIPSTEDDCSIGRGSEGMVAVCLLVT